ncbi:MAG: hypothetical protein FJ100_03460 [Deltaproteobacteria bacterium]|nr:hypothetical protein [Deltaproteobacteria bacterium]
MLVRVSLPPPTRCLPWWCAACAAWIVACGPAGPGPAGDDPDTGGGLFHIDVKLPAADAKADSAAAGDTPNVDAPDSATAATDATAGPQVTGLAISATATLAVGSRFALKVTVTRSDGSSGAPTAADAVTWSVDGATVATGSKLAADTATQPKLAVFKDSKTGAMALVAVRPGGATLKASIGGVESNEWKVTSEYATGGHLRLSTPTASGSCKGERQKDADDTIKLEGKAFGAGGLTLTVRFPAVAVAGDSFDLEKAPASGALQLLAVVPDLGGTQLKIPQARIWVDQTDKGWFRGTFLGTSASLVPVVGSFAVERNGAFGIDLLDDGLQIATSTTQKFTATGDHHSRVSVSAAPGGHAIVHWRAIHDVTTADFARAAVEAQSGQVAPLSPLVAKAIAAVLVDDGKGTLVPKPKGDFFGQASVATSGGKTLAVWEGKAGKGSASPYQISAQLMDDAYKPVGDVLAVAVEECWGDCRPQLVSLPSSRWLAVWGIPAGAGVRAAILDGNDLSAPEKLVTLAPAPATNPAVASLDANVGVIWRQTGKGTRYRLYSNTLSSNGPEQDLGSSTANPPAPQMLAVSTPPGFAALFFAPAADLKLRRIGLNASVLGPADVALATGIARVAAAAGKPGQLAVVERLYGQGADQAQLRVRKVAITSAGDPGATLGPPVELANSAAPYPVTGAIAYVPEADTYVVAWSGDATSDGVWVQRFR